MRIAGWWSALLPIMASAIWAGCDARLPDPDSPGAQLYAQRCASGCHRLYAPRLMTTEMWKITVDRMQGDLVRKGLPPLSRDEKALVMAYLKRHSSH